MGVYIKGMKMPKDCFTCPLKEEGFCNLTNAYANITNKINSDCPLVEVPEPHGRLIDEAVVLEMIRKSMGIRDLSFLYHAEKSVVNGIYHVPTVIESENE